MSIHLERPLITEIQVRMDCNGCVQKIRRALNTLQGIYDVYIDFPQQKVTVVGWVGPDQLMKAIKKAGKSPKLCSHVRDGEEETGDRADPATASASAPTTVTEEPADPNNQTVAEQNTGEQPPPPPADQPPAEGAAAPADAPPPENADQPPPAEPAPENPTPDPVPIPHDHPIHEFLIRNGLDGYQLAQEHVRDADYRYANEYYVRSYNNAPEYADPQRSRYSRRYMGGEQYYNGVPRQTAAADGNRFTSLFSDENPNACSIA